MVRSRCYLENSFNTYAFGAHDLGVDSPLPNADTCTKGSLDVYTNLVGQSVEQAMIAERVRRQ
jgi:hypothetical protein